MARSDCVRLLLWSYANSCPDAEGECDTCSSDPQPCSASSVRRVEPDSAVLALSAAEAAAASAGAEPALAPHAPAQPHEPEEGGQQLFDGVVAVSAAPAAEPATEPAQGAAEASVGVWPASGPRPSPCSAALVLAMLARTEVTPGCAAEVMESSRVSFGALLFPLLPPPLLPPCTAEEEEDEDDEEDDGAGVLDAK